MTRERAPRKAATTIERELLGAALDELIGAAIVLDDQLRIRASSLAAADVLGFDAPIGASASTVLCGDRPKRPFAEALAAGTPFQAVIPRPRGTAGERIRVRSIPLGNTGKPDGWLIHLHAIDGDDETPVEFHGMWTCDARMKETFRIIGKIAPEDMTVLVRGESGTGKELAAHAIHALSTRKDGPFRAINCAALPANLLESELFGHVRGSFTGAIKDAPGHMQLAHGGTLFLDEVAELPLELQAKLLRVLETRSVLPVGASDPVPVDVRIVSATHRALRAEVDAGRFRADLMFRLRVIPIRLPPLRERPCDVMLIASKIIDELNARGRRQVERVSAAAQVMLERHEWPGNVRELRNVLAYAFAIGEGPVIEVADLPAELAAVTVGGEISIAGATLAGESSAARDRDTGNGASEEARSIRDALARTGGNKDRAAKLLGLSRVTLWRRMRTLGLAK